jgi:hypothetical protein
MLSESGSETDNVTKFDAYRVALEAARHDTDNLWRTFSAFLVSESLVLGFLLNAIVVHRIEPGRRLPEFLGAVAGLILCGAWFASCARAAQMRDLRLHQARELEENPSRVLRDGAEFVAGRPVTASGRTFRLHPLLASNVDWTNLLILVFVVANLAVAIWALDI